MLASQLVLSIRIITLWHQPDDAAKEIISQVQPTLDALENNEDARVLFVDIFEQVWKRRNQIEDFNDFNVKDFATIARNGR